MIRRNFERRVKKVLRPRDAPPDAPPGPVAQPLMAALSAPIPGRRGRRARGNWLRPVANGFHDPSITSPAKVHRPVVTSFEI